jgi:Flp pilus assembly protein TadG
MKSSFSRPAQSRLASDQNGAAAVEFAFIAPVFMLMLFGMIAYAIYFGAAHSVQQLTADAARTAVAGLDQAERSMIVAEFVASNTANYSFLDLERISFESGEADGQFKVTVRYDAANLPIWNIFPAVIMPASTIRRESNIRIGGL